MRSQFDRARPRLTTGEEEPVRSNDVSCLPRPHHWTGSIYSRFSVVTIPSPRWLLGKYIRFLWLGNVCVAMMIKRGICTLCTRCVDPSLAGSTGLLSSSAAKTLQSFPPGPDWLLPAWSLHYGDIMAGAAHGDHWWWWYISDMSRHSEWWSLPRDAISSHCHHIPHTSTSQAKSLPEIFASNSSDHCCLTRLGITKCFQFLDIPNCVCYSCTWKI